MKRSKFYGFCKDLGSRVYMAQWGRNDTEPVAARLFAARLSVALSGPQMAKLLGVNRSSVWRWEHGEIESMSLYHVMRWAEVTGCSYHWLIHGGDIEDHVRYSYFLFLAQARLYGKLKTLPDKLCDELDIASSYRQRARQRKRLEERLREEEEDRRADDLAARQRNL